MKVTTEISHDLTPRYLAKALSECDPSEFAEFWFAFNDSCKPEKLDVFAQAIAPSTVSARKQPLRELCKLIDYHEIRLNREKA